MSGGRSGLVWVEEEAHVRQGRVTGVWRRGEDWMKGDKIGH